jgi:hypothetical protein
LSAASARSDGTAKSGVPQKIMECRSMRAVYTIYACEFFLTIGRRILSVTCAQHVCLGKSSSRS